MRAAPRRRGACPSVAVPMRTGDGWLARMTLPGGLDAGQLAGIGAAATRLGNGLFEVTSRGSLQVRGLAADGADALGDELTALGIEPAPGPPLVTSPLAGRDPAEIADPRGLAHALAGFPGRLAPKVSLVVDGGGAFPLDAVPADLRLRATDAGWQVGVGGATATCRWLAPRAEAEALARAMDLLGRLAASGGRGRDIDPGEAPVPPVAAPRPAASPAARFALGSGCARGVALAFGQTAAGPLAALAAAAGQARFHPAPGRCLVAVGIPDDEADAAFLAEAGRLGFVTRADDPRLRIAACAGAPACASARLATRRLAALLAVRPDVLQPALASGAAVLHLSGCPKRCAQPMGRAVTLVAGDDGLEVTGEGCEVPPGLGDVLIGAAAW